ncbi:MAG TPA: EF-P lysine aminoacylase EpmA [Steroidobacteraceae bacterium]|nr:EF-P lysine aminoacylase EpmA [Steroidobacteraceae bacterium]
MAGAHLTSGGSNGSAWRPTASMQALATRAALLATVRRHFADRGVLEVETPIWSAAGVTDVHIESLTASARGLGLSGFLSTSPEFAMKRLLAAGSGDIYQICRAFRDGERGRFHNPEFTLIEWYRIGFDIELMMNDVETLLAAMLAPLRASATWQPAVRLSYREALRRHAGVDAFDDSIAMLQGALVERGVTIPDGLGTERDPWLDLIMSTVVGPELGHGALCFIHDYPASQAALARLRPADRETAERFEAYLDGIELANGFRELADAAEQRRRFDADRSARRSMGRESPPIDENLLAALASGLPDCSGVALGFDRVTMLACGARSIDEVIAFAAERA